MPGTRDCKCGSALQHALITDPKIQAALQLLSVLAGPATFTDFQLFCLLACRMVSISIQHGMSGAAAYGYACLGSVLGTNFHRYREGYRLAKLACDLVEKHRFIANQPKVYHAAGTVAFWTQPIETAIARIVRDIGFRSSDYGRSLAAFPDGWLDRVHGTTTVISTSGFGPGQVFGSFGVAADKSGNIYATDFWGCRVLKFSATGKLLATGGKYATVANALGQPFGIAIDTPTAEQVKYMASWSEGT